MPFKATKSKKGFEIHGLEVFIEKKLKELSKALGLGGKKAKKPAAKRAAAKKPAAKSGAPLDVVLAALNKHPRKAQLVRAGKQKDQLLRSLIPLYLVRNNHVEISSGVTSHFWKKNGVKYLAPNAAKALREHVGYARRTKQGLQITPNGVKYVENALAAQRRAA